MRQLTLAGIPQSISGPFQSESKSSDSDGSERGPEFSVKDGPPGVQSRDIQRIVQFALLLCAVLCGLAYVKIQGMKYKNANNEQKKRRREDQNQ
jgi:hypothetical protein